MTAQDRIKSKLESISLPRKRISCYGRQIVVTCHSLGAAQRWEYVLGQFATPGHIVESVEDAKENKFTASRPTQVKIFRAYARISS